MPITGVENHELLVRFKAAGVGNSGSYFLPYDASYPYPIGVEAASVVEAVGNQVSAHRTDDQIEFINSIQSKDRT